MTNHIMNISLRSLIILSVLLIGVSSCKSRKNLAQVTPPEEEVLETEEVIEEELAEVVERIPEKIPTKEEALNSHLKAISRATTTSRGNESIDQALSMFSSSEAPVLIVIYNDGSTPDYDEPTTIGKYLNYLKDTKSTPAQVEEVVYDANGKIKELVLKK